MIPRPVPHGQTPNQPPTIYLIRHGEKNTTPQEGSLIGLNAAGEARAHALPKIFNEDDKNPYDIRFILAMQPQPDGDQERPWQTIWPLALSLQQTLNNYCLIDNTVIVNDAAGAAQRLKDFIASGSAGNIFVCWEHHNLHKILGQFGFADAPKYPGSMFDIVWELDPTPVVHHKTGNPVVDPNSGLPQWSYNTIRWSTEGTPADTLAANDALWKTTAGAPDNLVLSPAGSVPVFGWTPYVPNNSNPTEEQ